MAFDDKLFTYFFTVLCALYLLRLYCKYFKITWLFFRKPKKHIQDVEASSFMPVSLVVISKNNRSYLEENLPLWLDADYPKFEIIIVDNFSNDGTHDLVSKYVLEHKHISMITLDEKHINFGGKKLALSLASKAALYDYLVITEPDCQPVSRDRLKQLMLPFVLNPDTTMTIGNTIQRVSKNLFGFIYKLEKILFDVKNMNLTLSKRTFVVGMQNIAIKKQEIIDSAGFNQRYIVVGNKDNQFLVQGSKRKSTQMVAHPDALVVQKAHIRVKQVWASSLYNMHFSAFTLLSWFYVKKIFDTFILLLTYASFFYYIFHYPLTINTCIHSTVYISFFMVIVIKRFIFFVLFNYYKGLQYWALSELTELLYIPYSFLLYIFSGGKKKERKRKKRKKRKWKNRL